MVMREFPRHERRIFKVFNGLKTPSKIQDFLDDIPINFERNADTCRSPLMVLKHKEAHCMEGALLACAILWYQGKKPMLLDLKTAKSDESHVVALFKEPSGWGAVSKTNHSVLRYRDPIYKNVRELAMSYFHEYFLDTGVKTLRSFSRPFSILKYGNSWLTSENNLWNIVDDIDSASHFDILTSRMLNRLRRAGPIEIKSGKITEWH